MLLYDLNKRLDQEENKNYIDNILELLLKYAFRSSILLRSIAIDGLCKLLLNDKLEDSTDLVCTLMLLWHDNKIKVIIKYN